MARPEPTRRLIVNADDFGLSHSINQAVLRAHREGILTSASLMVNEKATPEAVELARQNPGLGVGLHLTLLCGHSALSPQAIPGLTDRRGRFPDNPVSVGFGYFASRALRPQLRAEIEGQFKNFRATGLPLDHVNGHLHFHLHPTVLAILMENATVWGISHLRLASDPFWLNARLASGRWFYRASHALIHCILSACARPGLNRHQIKYARQTFGLLQNALVDEAYIRRLLPVLPTGDSELYSHPSLDEFKNEFEALVSPRVKAQVKELGIDLIRYQDL